MGTRTDRIANVLRALSIIITVASLSWAIYMTIQRDNANEAKDTIEAIMMQQAEILLDARRQISRLKSEITELEYEMDSLLVLANAESIYREQLLKEIAYRDYIIQNLRKELHENIVIIDADPDEQLRLFLEWTTIRE